MEDSQGVVGVAVDSRLIGIKCVWVEQGKINGAGDGAEYVDLC